MCNRFNSCEKGMRQRRPGDDAREMAHEIDPWNTAAARVCKRCARGVHEVFSSAAACPGESECMMCS